MSKTDNPQRPFEGTEPEVAVLIVDDLPANVLALEALLGGQGYALYSATDGEQALAHLDVREFALVLSDVMMPDVDGIELVRRMKARPLARQTPVILMTAATIDTGRLIAAYEAGAVDYLQKPLLPDIVRTKVRVFVDLHRQKHLIRQQAELLQRRAEKESALPLALTRMVAEARSLQEAASSSLQTLCLFLGCEVGELWRLDDETASLRIVQSWAAPAAGVDAFHESSASLQLPPGAGLPGEVWVSGEPVWIDDIAGRDSHVSRSTAALRDGLRTAIAFPVKVEGKVAGVMSFFGRRMSEPRDHVFRMLASIGSQVGLMLERKHAEESVRRANEQLEQRVRERTAELAAANRELEAFSYSVSHDLRAPLRALDGFSQLVLDRHAGQLDERGRDYLQKVRSASQRMGHLIDDLLNLSRITRSEMRREPVDLSAIALSVATELAQREPARQVDVRVEPGLKAYGDPGLLRIAFENLLANAWKFTSLRPDARIAVERSAGPSSQTEVCVSDNGAGFDMRYVDKLFGAFQRLHDASEFPGSGIGLATVYRIVRRHGGTVRAEGEPGRGARFRMTLPETPS